MTITNSSLRLAALVAGVAVAVVLMGAVAVAPAQAQLSQTQIQSIVSLLASFGADQATINNVTAALNGQATPGTGGSTGGTGGACPALSRDLQQGSSGADVKALQVFLNGSASTMVAATGAGSPGNETMTFGPATKAAVMKFQTAKGITPVAGYVGAKTRAAIAASCGGSSTPGTTPTTGGAVSVMAGSQPVNSLAPLGANRVPFTTFTVSNNSAAAVTVNSVTVQRVGLGTDNNFSGIVLLDSNGLQIGVAKTLNSNHQANLDGFTLQAGASMTFTVAGNISSTATSNSGQVVGLQVVAINTGATVSGSLPISGASQTINTTLTLGTFSTTTSTFDPGGAQTKSIGDSGVRFTGIRITAGSAEDIKFYSIRWRNVGTVSSSDLSNVMTVIGDTSYPTTLSTDGKYYTTVIPGGLLIAKGNAVDVYVKGDIVGTNSASRTVDFDLDRSTDLYFVGQTYGYGVTDAGCGGSACSSQQPWFSGYVTTISAGSATTIGKANSVAAQNISVNVPNQPLGGFETDFKGEAVSITGLTITVATSSGVTGVITNASIVDQNGTVVAGPVDGTTAATGHSLVFTDTVTFPVGKHVYTVKGKIPSSGWSNGTTVTLTTVPSSTWTSPTGQTSGNSITLSQGSFSMNVMTVRAASLTAAMSTQPVSQNVVAGTNSLVFANVQLDATQSGEDIRMSAIPLTQTGTITDVSSCQLFDGTTALNTGSNVPSALSATGVHTTFTFDNTLVIAKGTVKTLTLKCNLGTAASGTYVWSIDSADAMTATGATSGVSVNVSETSGNSGTMTVGTGSFTATASGTAVAQPALARVTGGSTGVTIGSAKFRATNEAVTLTKVGLTLTNGTYGSSATGAGGSSNSGAGDVITAYLYNGSTLVGTASFTGTNTTATSTLSGGGLALAKDTDVILTIKADLASIGVSSSGGIGDTVKVDPLNAEGTGNSSGTTIRIGATAGVNGVIMTKSTPTFALASGACSGTGCNGSNQVLKSFTVTADAAGPISIHQLKVRLATSSATVFDVSVQVYDAGGNVATSTFGTQQCLTGTGCTAAAPTLTFTGGPQIIPAGQTYTFKVIGTVTPGSGATNWSVIATLVGTSTDVSGLGSSPTVFNATTTSILGAGATLIWSDNATTTAGLNDVDWFSGYQVKGLPSIGI